MKHELAVLCNLYLPAREDAEEVMLEETFNRLLDLLQAAGIDYQMYEKEIREV